MPDLWEALKFALGNVQRGGQKSREFLAGNPDPNILGEMPDLGMVITPSTVGKFSKLFLHNLFGVSKTNKNLPGDISRAAAFMKTKNPKLYDLFSDIVIEKLPRKNMAALGYNNELILDPTSNIGGVPGYIESVGHELGHIINDLKRPGIVDEADKARITLEKLYEMNMPAYRAEDILAQTLDERLASKAGDTAKSAYDKYMRLR